MNDNHRSFFGAAAAPAAVLTLFLATGCASIVCGTSQRVPVDSNPPGATVYLDGENAGETPLRLNLKRADAPYTVQLKLAGYEPSEEVQIDHKFNWWYAGNVVFGGLIGVVIDAVDGAMWKLDTEKVVLELKPRNPSGISSEVSAPPAPPPPDPPASAPSISPAPKPSKAPVAKPDSRKKLEKLEKWHEEGRLTDEEYEKTLEDWQKAGRISGEQRQQALKRLEEKRKNAP